jgi:hypothetical protein
VQRPREERARPLRRVKSCSERDHTLTQNPQTPQHSRRYTHVPQRDRCRQDAAS